MNRITRHLALRAGPCLAALSLVAGCGDGHVPREDSLTVAHLLASESVPTLRRGLTAEITVSAEVAGRTVDSVFRADMAPIVARLRGSGEPNLSLRIAVTSFRLNGDSAEAVIRRRGVDRADTTRFASSDTRYRLSWSRMNHWLVTSTEPFNFQGEGAPPPRPRDAWWDSTKKAPR